MSNNTLFYVKFYCAEFSHFCNTFEIINYVAFRVGAKKGKSLIYISSQTNFLTLIRWFLHLLKKRIVGLIVGWFALLFFLELSLRGLLNTIALILTYSRGNTEEKKAPKPTLVRVVSSETMREVHFDESAKKENWIIAFFCFFYF